MNKLPKSSEVALQIMRMDPDTGMIDCLVPVDDFSDIVSDADNAWRVVSGLEPRDFMAFSPMTHCAMEMASVEDCGTEFDAFFERSLSVHARMRQ